MIFCRWKMNAASGMTRLAASFSQVMQLTRWTRFPVFSATVRWSSLRGGSHDWSTTLKIFTFHLLCRYPLIDGTLFISPRQHTTACIQVTNAKIILSVFVTQSKQMLEIIFLLFAISFDCFLFVRRQTDSKFTQLKKFNFTFKANKWKENQLKY